jgi:hypothetical protein
VLFIGGHGRSGSTLLSRLLGQHPSAVSVGELTFIANRGWQSNHLCSCGTSFRKCDFWSAVVEQAAGPSPDQWFARLAYLKETVDRIRYIPSLALAFNKRKRSLLTAQTLEYMSMMEETIGAITSVADVGTVIDSSKYPPYGFFLANCEEIDLYPVHLVRDSRAVAFSQQRTRIRPDNYRATELLPRRTPAQTTFNWMIVNSLMQLLGRTSGRYFRIRYEDLVMEPERSLRGLLEWARLDSYSLDNGSSTAHDGNREHELSGNPMRFQRDYKITPDVQWLHGMSPRDKAIATAMSVPLLAKYGYGRVFAALRV